MSSPAPCGIQVQQVFNERVTAGLFKFCARGASISSAGTSSVVRLRSQQPVWKSPDCQHKRSQHRKEDVVKEGMVLVCGVKHCLHAV